MGPLDRRVPVGVVADGQLSHPGLALAAVAVERVEQARLGLRGDDEVGEAAGIAAYETDPDTFVEPHAGEVLYRLRSPGSGTGMGEPDGREPSPSGLDG